MSIEFRPAEPEEAAALTTIIQETSGGLVDFILTGVVPFTTPHQLLNSQVVTDDSPYSYRNAIVCEEDGEIIGMLLAYPWDKQVVSSMTKRYLHADKLKAVEPLMSTAEPDSLYINTFWVSDKYRGEGLADVLMDVAVEWAEREGFSRLSLHVWESNERAVRFYAKRGFVRTRSFSFPEHKLLTYKSDKLQLCKELV